MKSVTSETGELFGGLWEKLSDRLFEESVELFFKRATENDFDVDSLRGQRVLDAGCGSGRYSVALERCGAEVIAIDVSSIGIREAARRLQAPARVIFSQASVLDLPFRDESFDFVWSAGVIHHTSDMDLAISEFRRILRPGGRLFLLVYGTGGLRWKAVKSLRPIVRDLGQEFVDRAIKGAKLPANNRKHWLDDLFVPIQTLTSFYDLQSMLLSNRFSSIQRWVGNTFDHESSVESLLLDLEKLFAICQRAVVIARPGIESVLSNISIKIAGAYLDLARDVLSDQQLSAQQKRQIVIGEGNLRVIASAA